MQQVRRWPVCLGCWEAARPLFPPNSSSPWSKSAQVVPLPQHEHQRAVSGRKGLPVDGGLCGHLAVWPVLSAGARPRETAWCAAVGVSVWAREGGRRGGSDLVQTPGPRATSLQPEPEAGPALWPVLPTTPLTASHRGRCCLAIPGSPWAAAVTWQSHFWATRALLPGGGGVGSSVLVCDGLRLLQEALLGCRLSAWSRPSWPRSAALCSLSLATPPSAASLFEAYRIRAGLVGPSLRPAPRSSWQALLCLENSPGHLVPPPSRRLFSTTSGAMAVPTQISVLEKDKRTHETPETSGAARKWRAKSALTRVDCFSDHTVQPSVQTGGPTPMAT